MKKLTVKKGSECMACLQCVQACSEAFYKEFDPDLSCIQIVAKGNAAKPNVCIQCGKCMKACEHEAMTITPAAIIESRLNFIVIGLYFGFVPRFLKVSIYGLIVSIMNQSVIFSVFRP